MDQNGESRDLRDVVYGAYTYTAGLGALVELRLRLLAGRTPELEPLTYSQDLDGLEKAVHNHFHDQFTEDEKVFLEIARKLRNKILHCDFQAARSKIEEIKSEQMPSSGAHQLKLSDGAIKLLSETTKRGGGLFGWLLESMGNGVFKEAQTIFKRAADIYDRVTLEVATKDLTPEQKAAIERVKG